MNHHKPNGRQVGWERLDTHYPYDYPCFRIREDQVRLPDGQEVTYAYMETKGAVWVVPLTPDGQLVLIRQYRYAVDDWCWEIPAGGLHDHSGSLESLARRELAEEVGGSCGELVYVGWHYAGCSIENEICHVFLARDVRLDREPQREPGETIQTHLMPLDEALALVRSGHMRDGKSALAVLLCEPHLKPEQ
jgi:ADP-ribose pyrophosphatase